MSDDDFVITAEPAKKIITVSQNTFNVKIALKLYNQLDKLETDGHCVNENSQDLSNDNKDWKWTTRTWSNLINQVASNILQRPAKIDSDCWKVNLDAPNNYPRVELRLAAKKSKKRKASRMIFALFNPEMIPQLIKYCKNDHTYVVSHLCDEVKCVAPHHLEFVRNSINVARRECHRRKRCSKHAGLPDCVF
jgi:hypothetical protein